MQPHILKPGKKLFAALPVNIAVAYFVFGGVWILISDRLLAFFYHTASDLSTMQTYKGWFYMAITSLLLYYIIAQYKTVLQKQVKALNTTNRDLETFIYKSSHDLRGPIASMKGLINLALGELDDPKANLYLEKMNFTAQHLDDLLHELVAFINLKNSPLYSENISVKTFIENIILEMQQQETGNKTRFKINIPQDLYHNADSKIFKATIIYILDNAIKYSILNGHKSEVEIKASKQNHKVKIEIIDNGIGIDGAAKPYVFDMFYRGTERSEGHGLGLYITRSLIEKLDGSLEIESTNGKGTTVRMQLPDA